MTLQALGYSHPVAYTLFLRVFRHQFWESEVRDLRMFYRQFVERGSLVFDIGANRGVHSKAFLAVGAEVVAVEPLHSSVVRMGEIRDKNFTVIEACVGAKHGTTTLHVSDQNDHLCTASTKWLDIASSSQVYKHVAWNRAIEVPVITLDEMIQRYGNPNYIKIDVEGQEPEVLDGLAYLRGHMRFEFHPETIADTMACIAKPCFSNRARFNFITGEPSGPLMTEWKPAGEFSKVLSAGIRAEKFYGDVLVHDLI